MGVQRRVRGGCFTLVRIAGPDQRCAHRETVQEVFTSSPVGGAHGAVHAPVQAAESQPETLPGADAGGSYHGNVTRRVLRG